MLVGFWCTLYKWSILHFSSVSTVILSAQVSGIAKCTSGYQCVELQNLILYLILFDTGAK